MRTGIMLLVLLSLAAVACAQGEISSGGAVTTPKPASSAGKVPAAPAPQKRWEDTVTMAQKEGRVVVYTSVGAQTRPALAKAFKEKYGMEMEFVAGSGAELAAKVISERRAGLYLADAVIVGAGELLPSIKPTGVLDPIEPVLILPEVVDPGAWTGGQIPFLDKDRSIIAFIAGYRDFVAYNTDMVKAGQIKSYQDLLNPEWKGKLVLFDPARSGSGSEWFTFMLTKAWSREKGAEYMRQLAKQGPAFTGDGRLQVEWLARGKYPVAVATRRESTSEFIGLGAPVAWARNMVEGGEIAPGTGCLAVANRPAHPNAAALFVNWVLSREGQRVFAVAFASPSARKDVSIEGLDPAMIPEPGQKVYLTDEDFYLAKPEMIELSKQIFAGMLK